MYYSVNSVPNPCQFRATAYAVPRPFSNMKKSGLSFLDSKPHNIDVIRNDARALRNSFPHKELRIVNEQGISRDGDQILLYSL